MQDRNNWGGVWYVETILGCLEREKIQALVNRPWRKEIPRTDRAKKNNTLSFGVFFSSNGRCNQSIELFHYNKDTSTLYRINSVTRWCYDARGFFSRLEKSYAQFFIYFLIRSIQIRRIILVVLPPCKGLFPVGTLLLFIS